MLGNFCRDHEEQPKSCHFLRHRRWAIWEVNGRRKQGNGLEYVQLCSKPTAHTECFSPMSQHYPSTAFHYYKETSWVPRPLLAARHAESNRNTVRV